MKKDISLLSHKYRFGSLSAHKHGFPCFIEVDVNDSNFYFDPEDLTFRSSDSRFFVIQWVTSPRNPNYGKCYFRYNGDTYYFLFDEERR